MKIKSSRYRTLEKLYMSEFKMSLFENEKTEEFLLFMQNFNMKLNVSGTLEANEKIQYLLNILRGDTGSR